jgi:hypothetical protein
LKKGNATTGRADIAAATAVEPTIADDLAHYGLRP